MTALSINLNKIALIRNSREGNYPDVGKHADLCIQAGADGITIHPRPDQRHIRAADCALLKNRLNVELNIEGNPFAGPLRSRHPSVSDYPGFMAVVRDVRPAQCTLVPDSDDQLTSDHGFDLTQSAERLAPIVEELRALGIRVSLFLDPIAEQIHLAGQLGVDRIELYTGPYAAAFSRGEPREALLRPYVQAGELCAQLNLGLNAGHDLNLENLAPFAESVPKLREVSIGHAFTVDALHYGLAEAIRRYRQCLGKR